MAMIHLRDGRELKVKETMEELKPLVEAGEGLVEVTELRRVVLRKFHSPIDNLDEFKEDEFKHLIHAHQIMAVQPTVEEAMVPVVDEETGKETKFRPVVGEFAGAKAVSGPFEKNYERVLFDCDHVEEHHLEGQKGMGDIVVDGQVELPLVEGEDGEMVVDEEAVTRENFDDIKMM